MSALGNGGGFTLFRTGNVLPIPTPTSTSGNTSMFESKVSGGSSCGSIKGGKRIRKTMKKYRKKARSTNIKKKGGKSRKNKSRKNI